MLVGFQNQGIGVIIVHVGTYISIKKKKRNQKKRNQKKNVTKKNVTKMFFTGNISPNYSVTIDSTPPRPRDPY